MYPASVWCFEWTVNEIPAKLVYHERFFLRTLYPWDISLSSGFVLSMLTFRI